MTGEPIKTESLPILVVEDDDVTAELYSVILDYYGIHNFIICKDSRKAMPHLEKQEMLLVLLDLNMPFISGQELLVQMREQYPYIPVIVITVEDEVDTAVECMKQGAFDYMVKPVKADRFITVLNHAREIRELQNQVSILTSGNLTHKLNTPEVFSKIVTDSDSMKTIFRYIEAIADSPKAALVTGESGTGKELIAQCIHEAGKREGPFIAVNVSGVDETIFSDTLFGHKKGAFTGADNDRKGLLVQAAGGTLFLDEIGDLDSGSQIKLLRLLQENEYYPLGSDTAEKANVRIIAATNANLKERLESGIFRKDLYYRLMAHHIHIPPLRSRFEDLPVLVDHFLNQAAVTLVKRKPTVPKELLTLLSTYSFPGNVRELQSMIYDAVTRHSSGILSLNFFRQYIRDQASEGESVRQFSPGNDNAISYTGNFPTLKEVEDYFISEALDLAKGNQSIAAELLGVSQSTLSRRLSKK